MLSIYLSNKPPYFYYDCEDITTQILCDINTGEVIKERHSKPFE